jgi:DNA-binding transcriptional ArsR family regulator
MNQLTGGGIGAPILEVWVGMTKARWRALFRVREAYISICLELWLQSSWKARRKTSTGSARPPAQERFGMTDTDIALVAQRLEALGNETRLLVYRALVRAGPPGMAVGALQQCTHVARSTLSHHLRKLIAVGLVYQVRAGTTLCCHANFDAMNETLSFLNDECCAGAPEEAQRAAQGRAEAVT